MINGLTASNEQNTAEAYLGHTLVNIDSNISYDIEYSISKFAANIEFSRMADMTKIKTSIWKRRSGETLRNLRTGPTEISSSIRRSVNFCT